ncbi:hypothetical protein B0T26DRAFT_610839, partial [Lasiosphaeria miniovina]
SASASETSQTLSVRRKPIPRKGHTKSRRGCFACKRRKVKCQETQPACLNCSRIGLKCEYPPPPELSSLASQVWQLEPTQSQPPFTMQDFRFFHHFILNAFPPLPMNGDGVWQSVAALSHQYDYLLHAMLGLAASHLSLFGDDSSSVALSYRVKALQSLNQALNTPPTSNIEADARFATVLALAFQASTMPEGMVEWVTMARGCGIIARSEAIYTSEKSIFFTLGQQGVSRSIKRLTPRDPKNLPELPTEDLVREFLVSLRAIAPLCSSPIEVMFLAEIERAAKLATVSADEAFAALTGQYVMLSHASEEEYAPFTNPENYAVQLLLIHFSLIEYAMGARTLSEEGIKFVYRKWAAIRWVGRLVDTLPEEFHQYLEWPIKYAQ